MKCNSNTTTFRFFLLIFNTNIEKLKICEILSRIVCIHMRAVIGYVQKCMTVDNRNTQNQEFV